MSESIKIGNFLCHAEILKLKTLQVLGRGWDRESVVGVLMTKPGINLEVLHPVSIIFHLVHSTTVTMN